MNPRRHFATFLLLSLTVLMRFDLAGAGILLRTVALTGQSAPGTEAGVTFANFDPPLLDASGKTAFYAELAGPSIIVGENNASVWSDVGGSLALVARGGDSPPGGGAGVRFNRFFDPIFNSTGQTAFDAQLSGTGLDTTNDDGIWSDGGGPLALIAREGGQAPGTNPGIDFINFGHRLLLNNVGRAALKSDLIGPGVDVTNNVGIWSEGGGGLALIARAGDPPPVPAPA